MKYNKKVILGIIAVLAIVICLIGLYWRNKVNKANTDSWEEEFYYCVDVMEERIENLYATEYILSEYDEKIRQERRTLHLNGWKASTNFVETWVELAGDTKEEKEEIFKKGTILMAVLYDTPAVNYELGFYHGEVGKQVFFCGKQALQRETIIDTSIVQFNEEFEEEDYYGEIYRVEADAWESEFLNCRKKLEELLYAQTEDELEHVENKAVLELWENFVAQWTEYNIKDAMTESGSGMDIYMAEEKRDGYRTATLLMIAYYEQHFGEYEFVYDEEAAKETLRNAISY